MATKKYSREWAMPNPDTFSIKPIALLLQEYLANAELVVDPFARNSTYANITNDLDPRTTAYFHWDAVEFLEVLATVAEGLIDAVLLDPPYSPRQVKECYDSIGLHVSTKDTQTAHLYKECKDRIAKALKVGGLCICFGWNSVGMGIKRGFVLVEVLLVCHGGAHNDTIVTVERKL